MSDKLSIYNGPNTFTPVLTTVYQFGYIQLYNNGSYNALISCSVGFYDNQYFYNGLLSVSASYNTVELRFYAKQMPFHYSNATIYYYIDSQTNRVYIYAVRLGGNQFTEANSITTLSSGFYNASFVNDCGAVSSLPEGAVEFSVVQI